MKTRRLLILAIACLCPACADLKLAGIAVETPYGSITSDKEGRTTFIIRPIVIDEK